MRMNVHVLALLLTLLLIGCALGIGTFVMWPESTPRDQFQVGVPGQQDAGRVGMWPESTPRDQFQELHDPIEDNPAVRPLIEAAGREASVEAEKYFRDHPMRMGRGGVIRSFQKEILKTKYGIDWRTPAEMNPHICYD